MSSLRNKSKEVILLGDFNIDLLKINEHTDSNVFYNCLTSYHYLPTITRPTRITTNTSSLIDNIYCSSWSKLLYSYVIVSDLSDHFPVLACFSFETPGYKSPDRKDVHIVNDKGLSVSTSPF